MTGEYIYVVLRVSYLWPWNCIITASALADARLKDNPFLKAVYSSTMMSTSTLVALSVSFWLAGRPFHHSLRVRYGLLMIIGSFSVATVASALLSGTAWFVLIMGAVAASSVGTTLAQNGSKAIAQSIPRGSHGFANMSGQTAAALAPPAIAFFTSSLQRVQIAVALLNFALAVVIPLIALVLFAPPTNAPLLALAEKEIEEIPEPPLPWEKVKDVISEQMAAPTTAIFLGYAVSFWYPVFANRVLIGKSPWSAFSPQSHLAWNLGDLSGRLLCTQLGLRIQYRLLVQYSVARASVFVILLAMAWCADINDFSSGMVFYVYGQTSGQLIASALSYISSVVDESSPSVATAVADITLYAGQAAGALASFIFVPLIP